MARNANFMGLFVNEAERQVGNSLRDNASFGFVPLHNSHIPDIADVT